MLTASLGNQRGPYSGWHSGQLKVGTGGERLTNHNHLPTFNHWRNNRIDCFYPGYSLERAVFAAGHLRIVIMCYLDRYSDFGSQLGLARGFYSDIVPIRLDHYVQ